jgi:hypothetical protein
MDETVTGKIFPEKEQTDTFRPKCFRIFTKPLAISPEV